MLSRQHRPLQSLLLIALGSCISLSAWSADLPKRKSGLWEIHTQVAGSPSPAPIQLCVDQTRDNLMQDQATSKPDCSVMDVKQSGGKTILHTVCRMEQTTVTTDGVMSGDFSSGYKSDMTLRYAPPLHGMSETRVTQESRYLGPCAKGQKPGDIVMPGRGTLNPAELMNDPRFKEMLQRQQR